MVVLTLNSKADSSDVSKKKESPHSGCLIAINIKTTMPSGKDKDLVSNLFS